MQQPTTIKIDYPEGMSDADKAAMYARLNALFEKRGFASDAEMEAAVLAVMQEHFGLDMEFKPSQSQLWLERIPLVISAVILVAGLCWRYGLVHW